MRLSRLIRIHLLHKIEYLCEPARFNTSPEEAGKSLFIGLDAGWKPHGDTRVVLHSVHGSAVEGGTRIEAHKGRIVGEELTRVRVHPSGSGIVAEGERHQRCHEFLVRSSDCRYARHWTILPGCAAEA